MSEYRRVSSLFLYLRLISILLVFCLMLHDVVWANPKLGNVGSSNPSEYQNFSKNSVNFSSNPIYLKVPNECATLQEVHVGHSGKLIIHIQDPHSNYSGQKAIAKVVDYYAKQYGIQLILVEGADRDVSLHDVRPLTSGKNWKILANRLLYEGIISGEEYTNLTTDHPLELLGMEDQDKYNQGVYAYAEIVKTRAEALKYLHQVKNSIQALKERIYPSELMNYEESVQGDYSHSNNDYLRRIEQLDMLSDQNDLFIGDLENVARLQELRRKEKQIDFYAVQIEQGRILSRLKSDASQLYAESLRKQRDNPIATLKIINELLEEAQIAHLNHPNLSIYQRYLEQFLRIRMSEVVEEYQILEKRIYDELLLNKESQQLRAVDQFISLLTMAYKLQMTTNDYALYKANQKLFERKAWNGILNRFLADHELYDYLIPDESVLDSTMTNIDLFYRIVSERDEAFVENASEGMNKHNARIALMIAGGYHTQNLTDLLRKKGHSYIVLSPQVQESTDHLNYERLLLNQIGTSLPVVPQEDIGGLDAIRLSAWRMRGGRTNGDIREQVNKYGSKSGTRLADQIENTVALNASRLASKRKLNKHVMEELGRVSDLFGWMTQSEFGRIDVENVIESLAKPDDEILEEDIETKRVDSVSETTDSLVLYLKYYRHRYKEISDKRPKPKISRDQIKSQIKEITDWYQFSDDPQLAELKHRVSQLIEDSDVEPDERLFLSNQISSYIKNSRKEIRSRVSEVSIDKKKIVPKRSKKLVLYHILRSDPVHMLMSRTLWFFLGSLLIGPGLGIALALLNKLVHGAYIDKIKKLEYELFVVEDPDDQYDIGASGVREVDKDSSYDELKSAFLAYLGFFDVDEHSLAMRLHVAEKMFSDNEDYQSIAEAANELRNLHLNGENIKRIELSKYKLSKKSYKLLRFIIQKENNIRAPPGRNNQLSNAEPSISLSKKAPIMFGIIVIRIIQIPVKLLYLMQLSGQMDNLVNFLRVRIAKPEIDRQVHLPNERSQVRLKVEMGVERAKEETEELRQYTIKQIQGLSLNTELTQQLVEKINNLNITINNFHDNDWMIQNRKPNESPSWVFGKSGYNVDANTIILSSRNPRFMNALIISKLLIFSFQHEVIVGKERNVHLADSNMQYIHSKLMWDYFRRIRKGGIDQLDLGPFKDDIGLSKAQFLQTFIHGLSGRVRSYANEPGVLVADRHRKRYPKAADVRENFMVSFHVLKNAKKLLTNQPKAEFDEPEKSKSKLASLIGLLKPFLKIAQQLLPLLPQLIGLIAIVGILLQLDFKIYVDGFIDLFNIMDIDWLVSLHASLETIRAILLSIWDWLLPIRTFFSEIIISKFILLIVVPAAVFIVGTSSGYVIYKTQTVKLFMRHFFITVPRMALNGIISVPLKAISMIDENMAGRIDNTLSGWVYKLTQGLGTPLHHVGYWAAVIFSTLALILFLIGLAYPPASILTFVLVAQSFGLPLHPMMVVFAVVFFSGIPFSIFWQILDATTKKKSAEVKANTNLFVVGAVGMGMTLTPAASSYAYWKSKFFEGRRTIHSEKLVTHMRTNYIVLPNRPDSYRKLGAIDQVGRAIEETVYEIIERYQLRFKHKLDFNGLSDVVNPQTGFPTESFLDFELKTEVELDLERQIEKLYERLDDWKKGGLLDKRSGVHGEKRREDFKRQIEELESERDKIIVQKATVMFQKLDEVAKKLGSNSAFRGNAHFFENIFELEVFRHINKEHRDLIENWLETKRGGQIVSHLIEVLNGTSTPKGDLIIKRASKYYAAEALFTLLPVHFDHKNESGGVMVNHPQGKRTNTSASIVNALSIAMDRDKIYPPYFMDDLARKGHDYGSSLLTKPHQIRDAFLPFKAEIGQDGIKKAEENWNDFKRKYQLFLQDYSADSGSRLANSTEDFKYTPYALTSDLKYHGSSNIDLNRLHEHLFRLPQMRGSAFWITSGDAVNVVEVMRKEDAGGMSFDSTTLNLLEPTPRSLNLKAKLMDVERTLTYQSNQVRRQFERALEWISTILVRSVQVNIFHSSEVMFEGADQINQLFDGRSKGKIEIGVDIFENWQTLKSQIAVAPIGTKIALTVPLNQIEAVKAELDLIREELKLSPKTKFIVIGIERSQDGRVYDLTAINRFLILLGSAQDYVLTDAQSARKFAEKIELFIRAAFGESLKQSADGRHEAQVLVDFDGSTVSLSIVEKFGKIRRVLAVDLGKLIFDAEQTGWSA